MEWDTMDSESQAVRRIEIWAIGRGVQDEFESDGALGPKRRGAPSSTS